MTGIISTVKFNFLSRVIICAGGILLLLFFCWGHSTWLIELILVAIFFENVNI